jgi:hypothetical protein
LHTEITKIAKTDFEMGDLRSVVHPFLCVLCDLRVDRLSRVGFLHTEIAKIAKTDLNWVTLNPWSYVPWRSLRSPCGSSFLIGFLHTEIAKIAKTDFEMGDLRSVVHPFLCVLCDLRVDRLF